MIFYIRLSKSFVKGKGIGKITKRAYAKKEIGCLFTKKKLACSFNG